MRTTLTIEDDVAARLERVRNQRRGSLKQVINDVLREGLASLELPPRSPVPYHTPTSSLGRCILGGLDNITEALALAEGEGYK